MVCSRLRTQTELSLCLVFLIIKVSQLLGIVFEHDGIFGPARWMADSIVLLVFNEFELLHVSSLEGLLIVIKLKLHLIVILFSLIVMRLDFFVRVDKPICVFIEAQQGYIVDTRCPTLR